MQQVTAAPVRRPLNILQIGDSHTAGESITGALRETLQKRYGSGGRGVLPPGITFKSFNPRGVLVEQSDGWTLQTLRASRGDDPPKPFGISAFRLTAMAAGARLTLSARTQDFAFDRFQVCALSGPAAGAFEIDFGGRRTRVDLAGADVRVRCIRLTSDIPESTAAVETAGGEVSITSWGGFADRGGVTVSNLGVIGARLGDFAGTDDDAVQVELQAYEPDLLIIAFGTNEGFDRALDPERYAGQLRVQVARLRRLAPGVPILLLGAPDAEARQPVPRRRARRSAPTFSAPPALQLVRDIQRQVARELDVPVWDWFGRMGGPGTAARWAAAAPALMYPDHVHYTAAGGAVIAELLDRDLEAAKAAYLLGSP